MNESASEDNVPIVAPYAAVPQPLGSRSFPDPRRLVWRQQNALVFHELAELPDRCIKCNGPAHGIRLKKRVSWVHPAWMLLLLVGVLFYLVALAIVRKRAEVSLGFCKQHLNQRRAWLAAAWLALGASFLVLYLALLMQSGPTALAGLGLLLGSIVAGIVTSRFVGLKKIENNYVWLKYVNGDYLARFPSLD
ncbi:MAG TPA: hypothetical protein VEZ90_09500 [Blastocatellia bacterium]|nr:hypothetical protein [Blastocatellia bacterium]